MSQERALQRELFHNQRHKSAYIIYFEWNGKVYYIVYASCEMRYTSCVDLRSMLPPRLTSTKSPSQSRAIDATAFQSANVSRFANHSRLRPNAFLRTTSVGGHPQAFLVSGRAIGSGEEITFDYGEKRSNILGLHPWLVNS